MLGGVWSFGSGYSGQLGHGDLESSGTPRLIKKLRGKGISQVYAVRLCSHVDQRCRYSASHRQAVVSSL